MLGWMLKRGLEGVGEHDAMDRQDMDDTQIDQPDTPGPVFAARALKSAIFGTPTRPGHDDDGVRRVSNDDTMGGGGGGGSIHQFPDAAGAVKKTAPKQATCKTATAPVTSTSISTSTNPLTKDIRGTPGRLPGILLTPGTATARRKRVSFGHDVELNDGSGGGGKKKEFKIDRAGRRSNNLFGEAARPRTKLSGSLEGARKQSASRASLTFSAERDGLPSTTTIAQAEKETVEEDGAWEEIKDEDDKTGEWDPDVTVDLNEPHSQSGQFWKAQFQRYQEDAKTEMSKLLKYKQLAKSYAKMKDAEAVDMRAKLREEKDKVVQMEDRITELAGEIARKRIKGTGTARDYQDLISDLTRQTALAAQYRNQVKELEAMLQDSSDRPDDETAESLVRPRRRSANPITVGAVSPRTQRTLIETQRELQRAREQVRELTRAQDEARRLKTALRAAEQRALQSESDARTLRADLEAATAKVQDGETRAQFAEDERRRRDEELRQLQSKYDALKNDAKARVSEAEQVLRRKNEQIAGLKKGVQVAKVREEAVPARCSSALTALEKLTRTRYETLRDKRHSAAAALPKAGKADAGAGEGAGAGADTGADSNAYANTDGNSEAAHLDKNGLDKGLPVEEPALPLVANDRNHNRAGSTALHGIRGRHHVLDDPSINILEDDPSTSHFEMPALPALPLTTTRTRTATATAATRLKSLRSAATTATTKAMARPEKEADAKEDRLLTAQLRRRRAADPLRTIAEPQHALPPQTLRAVSKTTATAADTSRVSLSSERAAAAVARIEKRRAERKRTLDQLRNKENMQPA